MNPPQTARMLRLEAAVAVAAAVATGLLVRSGTGPDAVPLLTWWVPLPMLLVAPAVRPLLTGIAALAGWAAGMTNQWDWATGTLRVPDPVAAGVIGLHAAVFAGLVLLLGALVRRGHDLAAVLAVPAGAVAAEYLESLVSPYGTLLGPAVTQADLAPLRAVAAATGGWGVTALLQLVPACVAVVLFRLWLAGAGRRLRAVRTGLVSLLVAAVAATALGLTARHLAGTPDRAGRTKVAAVVAPEPSALPDLPGTGSPLRARLPAAELDGVRQARAAGATLVVLAETVATADDVQLAARTLALRQAAGPGVSVVIGGRHRDRYGVLRDEARLLAPGKADVVYTGRHLLPRRDDGLQAGTAAVTARTAAGTWALALGPDLPFPGVTRQYAGRGADLLLVPARDEPADGRYRSRLAVLRAAEQGLPMVRAARGGRLTISDASGRVLREAPSSASGTVVLVADLPLTAVRTPYGRTGDVLPWICGIVLALAIGLALGGRDPDLTPG
jgi:apolipoprotein N-acyltransferase